VLIILTLVVEDTQVENEPNYILDLQSVNVQTKVKVNKMKGYLLQITYVLLSLLLANYLLDHYAVMKILFFFFSFQGY